MLDNKISIVTGGARGIGRVIAEQLASQKSKVFVWDIIKLKTQTTLRVPELKTQIVDITNLKEVEDTIKSIGDIDILINNAGINIDKLLLRMEEKDWDKVIDVNLKGVFNCTKSCVPFMLKKRWGRIINISSVIGIIGNKAQANYAASKAGIMGFTKSIAKEYASRNITCNAIAPGYIETDMTANLPQAVKDAYLSVIPLKRAGTPEDVANLVSFLVSDAASYITGQVINIDGGMVM